MAKEKILVVDDDPDVREVIKLALEPKGYHILEAENGEVAIDTLKQGDNLTAVGLILCDVRMPKVNGIGCFEYLRKLAPEIPFVMLTGYPDAQMAANFVNKGGKAYLVKPIDREKLLETVVSFVREDKDSDS